MSTQTTSEDLLARLPRDVRASLADLNLDYLWVSPTGDEAILAGQSFSLPVHRDDLREIAERVIAARVEQWTRAKLADLQINEAGEVGSRSGGEWWAKVSERHGRWECQLRSELAHADPYTWYGKTALEAAQACARGTIDSFGPAQ